MTAPPGRTERRDVTVATVAVVAIAAAAAWVVTRDVPPRRDPPPAARPPATASPAPVAAEGPALVADVDGDGAPDRVALVESGDRAADTWRFGVRVLLATGAERVAWYPPGEGFNDAQEVAGSADVDGDGAAEVAVLLGTTVSARHYGLVTLAGDRLTVVPGTLQAERVPGRTRSWGCRDGRVHRLTVHREGDRFRGALRYYRLTAGRLVADGTATRTWSATRRPPPGYGGRAAVRCGSVGET
ncbi:MAG TPA: hypothetical protein VNA20_14385 [Frankiaceae bacterium]|nr:hypothetical protein [Frankiaceae bacterium]